MNKIYFVVITLAVLGVLECSGTTVTEFFNTLPEDISNTFTNAWDNMMQSIRKPVRIKRLGHGRRKKNWRHKPSTTTTTTTTTTDATTEAFEETWLRMKQNFLYLSPKRISRMGLFQANTPTLLKHYTTMGQYPSYRTKLVIPILPTPKSRYRYRWRLTVEPTAKTDKHMEQEQEPEDRTTVVPSLPLLLHTTQDPVISGRTTREVGYSNVLKLKNFKIRVTYKWQLVF